MTFGPSSSPLGAYPTFSVFICVVIGLWRLQLAPFPKDHIAFFSSNWDDLYTKMYGKMSWERRRKDLRNPSSRSFENRKILVYWPFSNSVIWSHCHVLPIPQVLYTIRLRKFRAFRISWSPIHGRVKVIVKVAKYMAQPWIYSKHHLTAPQDSMQWHWKWNYGLDTPKRPPFTTGVIHTSLSFCVNVAHPWLSRAIGGAN